MCDALVNIAKHAGNFFGRNGVDINDSPRSSSSSSTYRVGIPFGDVLGEFVSIRNTHFADLFAFFRSCTPATLVLCLLP